MLVGDGVGVVEVVVSLADEDTFSVLSDEAFAEGGQLLLASPPPSLPSLILLTLRLHLILPAHGSPTALPKLLTALGKKGGKEKAGA